MVFLRPLYLGRGFARLVCQDHIVFDINVPGNSWLLPFAICRADEQAV